MDWVKWSRRLDRSGLERIVALLLAFAVLAERAAALTGARGQRALGILAYAEAEARAFVISLAQESGTPGETATEATPAHGRAERLAASFRALAFALTAMLALARRFGRPVAAGRQAEVPKPSRKTSVAPKGRLWAAAVPALDTS